MTLHLMTFVSGSALHRSTIWLTVRSQLQPVNRRGITPLLSADFQRVIHSKLNKTEETWKTFGYASESVESNASRQRQWFEDCLASIRTPGKLKSDRIILLVLIYSLSKQISPSTSFSHRIFWEVNTPAPILIPARSYPAHLTQNCIRRLQVKSQIIHKATLAISKLTMKNS